MGVVDFDPEDWRRDNPGVEAAQAAKVANPAKAEPTLATLATLAADPLSPHLRDGLIRLREMPRPRMSNPDNWAGIVSDCLRLAASGWAQRALHLGWEPLNLWGVSPVAGGLSDLEGLGVWLAGRDVVLLDNRCCIVADGPNSRSIFNRRSMEGAVLLWEVGGRGR